MLSAVLIQLIDGGECVVGIDVKTVAERLCRDLEAIVMIVLGFDSGFAFGVDMSGALGVRGVRAIGLGRGLRCADLRTCISYANVVSLHLTVR